ncbi:MAG: ABC transporter permease, partial [bacterium]
AMFKNYLKIALRNIKKYKFYSLTTVAGLTFGMSCSILILLYVKDELSYERHHEKADRIYRVIMQLEGQGQVESSVAHTSLTLAPKLGSTFPEIEKAVRLLQWRKVTLGHEDKMFNVEQFFLADQSIFEVFTFQFLAGDPKTALTEPYSAVITASTAKRYFGDADPLGKLLTAGNKEVYKVTGVIADMPPQSHFHCDFIGSLATLGEISDPYRYWGHIYLLLPAGYSPAELEEKLVAITNQEALGWFFYGMRFRLQPITKIHLYSRHSGELEPNGDIRFVYIFSTIALLILFIACVNYMNMATARFTHRAREVGIRKVFGSQRLHLIGQFLGESVLFSFGAVILSLM